MQARVGIAFRPLSVWDVVCAGGDPGNKVLIPIKPCVPGVYILTLELVPYVPGVARMGRETRS